MPIRGVLTAFLIAVIFAFVYRESIVEWFDAFCDEDKRNNKDKHDFKEEHK